MEEFQKVTQTLRWRSWSTCVLFFPLRSLHIPFNHRLRLCVLWTSGHCGEAVILWFISTLLYVLPEDIRPTLRDRKKCEEEFPVFKFPHQRSKNTPLLDFNASPGSSSHIRLPSSTFDRIHNEVRSLTWRECHFQLRLLGNAPNINTVTKFRKQLVETIKHGHEQASDSKIFQVADPPLVLNLVAIEWSESKGT